MRGPIRIPILQVFPSICWPSAKPAAHGWRSRSRWMILSAGSGWPTGWTRGLCRMHGWQPAGLFALSYTARLLVANQEGVIIVLDIRLFLGKTAISITNPNGLWQNNWPSIHQNQQRLCFLYASLTWLVLRSEGCRVPPGQQRKSTLHHTAIPV